jgi:serine/threonine protein kinase/tetratricopeptide (TPR) repeat protein
MNEREHASSESERTTTDASSATARGRVGNYRLLEKIGEGGMGEVYAAEQEKPVRRRVALKLIKLGMDTREVVARFESERQALALMDHPNIARVYDAGATDQGRPYFVMEHVQGIPLIQYCDDQELSIQDRLQLFIQLCEGVQHAHQKGIIHRDLKPSNILVAVQDGKPVPKIIDFGVAKATAQRLTERTLYTSVGQFIGTPEYMSPEQAELTGLDIDTRSDVYSLGVVLYELLTGELPYDRKELLGGGVEEFRRRIRESVPARPSTRVSTSAKTSTQAARRRGTEMATLVRRLRGDLDWITLKALEKDRTRRYASASELAHDIRRHLRHEPVLASPPSTAYRLAKFVRRHRGVVTATSVAFLAVVAGLVTTSVSLLTTVRAERKATQEAATAKEVTDFMVSLFEVSDPYQLQGDSVTAREILGRGAAKVRRELNQQPEVQARLMDTMGTVYTNLGLFEEAVQLFESALEIREKTLGPDHLDVAMSLNSLGQILTVGGDYARARQLHERALRIQERELSPDHPDVATSLTGVAEAAWREGDYGRAQKLFRRVLKIREAAQGPEDLQVALALNSLANVLWTIGDYEEARSLYERDLAISEKKLGREHPDVAVTLNNLANLLSDAGDSAAAIPLHERALAIYEKVFGPEHPHVATSLTNLGLELSNAGDHARAEPMYERALAIREKAFGPDHPNVAHTLHNLALLRLSTGNLSSARLLWERALAINEKAFGSEHIEVANNLLGLARVFDRMARYGQAKATYEKALALYEANLKPTHPTLAKCLKGYAETLRKLGRHEEAEKIEARAREITSQEGL